MVERTEDDVDDPFNADTDNEEEEENEILIDAGKLQSELETDEESENWTD